MWKKIIGGLLLVFVVFLLWNWKWVQYGYWQARGQLKVITEARPIDEFLADPQFPDSLKQKLQLTKIVRQFALHSLGLNASDNYTTLYDQHGQTLLWNVSASEPYKLEAHEWQYPFLGSMPYKGFFDLEKAKAEAEVLKKQGYDVRIRPVGGWSTLGILQDPLLSNMLERTDGELAEVIIHELTHATLFVKNEVDFNENLASFIGVKGAELFLKNHYGDSSLQMFNYLHSLQDEQALTQLILQGANQLDSLYSGFEDTWPTARKDSLKHLMMLHIKDRLDSTHFYNPKYQRIFDRALPNNAYFMMFRRYHSEEDSIQGIYENYHENIQLMLDAMKAQYGK